MKRRAEAALRTRPERTPPYGLGAATTLRDLPQHPEVLELLGDLVASTYEHHLGFLGRSFVADYLHSLDEISPSSEAGEIVEMLLRHRRRFSASLWPRYREHFRNANLRSSLELAEGSWLRGRALDVGAGDNRLGRILLDDYPRVVSVVGVDIERRPEVEEGGCLEFRVMPDHRTLPCGDREFALVILRYSLHHMTWSEQEAVLREAERALSRGGVILIFENSYSRMRRAVGSTIARQFHRRALALGDRELHLLMSSLDLFSLGIKEKNQPFPFTFRTVEGWRQILAERFVILHEEFHAFQMADLHPQPLAFFVLTGGGGRGPR